MIIDHRRLYRRPRFAGFGDPLSDADAATFNASADKVIAAAKQESASLRSKQSGISSLFTSQSSIDATNSALNNLDNLITTLDTTQRQDVLSGDYDASKWLASGQLVLSTIQSLGKDQSDYSIGTLTSQSLSSAASDLANIGKKTLQALQDAGNAALAVTSMLPWLLVGAGGLVLFLKFKK